MAGVPYRYVNDPKGGQMAIMDRRAWLHSVVFEARAAPEDSHRVRFVLYPRSLLRYSRSSQHWSRAISMFNLHDPATYLPFPTPFPRTALPLMADFQLSSAYTNWRTMAVTKATQMQIQANTAAIYNAARPSLFGFGGGSNFLSNFTGGGNFGGGGFGIGGGGGGGGGGASDPEKATWLDATTAVAKLANTIIGVATGGGGIPGFS